MLPWSQQGFVQSVSSVYFQSHTQVHVCTNTYTHIHTADNFLYIFNVGCHLMSHSLLLPTQTSAKHIAEQPNVERRGEKCVSSVATHEDTQLCAGWSEQVRR